MRILTLICMISSVLQGSRLLANPYPDENAVPKDQSRVLADRTLPLSLVQMYADAQLALRVEFAWDEKGERFFLADSVVENSGTNALARRARHRDPHGSYVASLSPTDGSGPTTWASIGTGSEFRQLTRALTFRFPAPTSPVMLRLLAEHPVSGDTQEVLAMNIDPKLVRRSIMTPESLLADGTEVRLVRAATASNRLIFNVYAEGYSETKRAQFWRDASRAADALAAAKWPGLEHFEIRAVFAPSTKSLGRAQNLGLPIPERDSFLGLYFPYWRDHFRWYHVLYPTREARYRRGLAVAPYDHPIAIVDDAEYWGVGNFNELTAIPARSSSFTYLLLHELGHYFGLNEEYEGGGPTELAFAPGIREPWSQNITFLADASALKWRQHVSPSIPIPTPESIWQSGRPIGAYAGGYANSEPQGHSHKPGFQCVMESGRSFCSVCNAALRSRVEYDLSLD